MITQAILHCFHQLLGSDRLPQHAGKVALVDRAAFAGDDDDRNLIGESVGAHLAVHVTSVQARQPKVEHHGRGGVRFQIPERVETILHGNDSETSVAQRRSMQLARLWVVFNNQHDDTGPQSGRREHRAL